MMTYLMFLDWQTCVNDYDFNLNRETIEITYELSAVLDLVTEWMPVIRMIDDNPVDI